MPKSSCPDPIHRVLWCVLVVMITLSPASLMAEMVLGTPFNDGMVLQRDLAIPVWGWTTPGTEVQIDISGQTKQAVADAQGFWRVMLDAMPAGGPHELRVRGASETRLGDVLVGEVWLASGQSNMDMRLQGTENSEKNIAEANFPQVRLLTIPTRTAALPQIKPGPGRRPVWVAARPDQAGRFSAVAYLFARDLHQALNVPVGMIVAARGATRIEPWIADQGLQHASGIEHFYAAQQQVDQKYRQALAAYEQARAAGQDVAAPVHPRLQNDHVDQPVFQQMGTLYKGTLAQIAGYGIRGAIWYQGESNRGDSGHAYFILKQALIAGWRGAWAQGDFPFYFVQIASLDGWRPRWHIPEIWDGQRMSLAIPNTGMAVIHDLHKNLSDIHPIEKEGVAHRLVLLALARTYGQDLVDSGPLFHTTTVEGARIRVHFEHTDGGLATRDGKNPDWFSIAAADLNFVPAQARIEGDSVVVWHDDIAHPVAVALAWYDAAQPNLINGAGLPASPFRAMPGR